MPDLTILVDIIEGLCFGDLPAQEVPQVVPRTTLEAISAVFKSLAVGIVHLTLLVVVHNGH